MWENWQVSLKISIKILKFFTIFSAKYPQTGENVASVNPATKNTNPVVTGDGLN